MTEVGIITGMDSPNESLTKSAYEDPRVVAGYVAEQGLNPKMLEAVEKFAKTLSGRRVIDIGCGPGQDSWHFAKLGFEVMGLDYSEEMIVAAKKLDTAQNTPKFIVGDMKGLEDLFLEDSFDGAWACASLLHITRNEVPKVLRGIKKIVVNGGKVYMGFKQGAGEEIKKEDKYGPQMERRFVYWEKDQLENLFEQGGFKVVNIDAQQGGGSTWLNFYLENKK